MILQQLENAGYNVTNFLNVSNFEFQIPHEIQECPASERHRTFKLQQGSQHPTYHLWSNDKDGSWLCVDSDDPRLPDINGKCSILEMDINNPYSKKNGVLISNS
jgi:hypothetical protein